MDTLEYRCGTPCPKCGGHHVLIDPSYILTSYPAQYHFRCPDCDHTWVTFQESRIGWPDLEPDIAVKPSNYGWICPKCGRVYSPTTDQCLFCGGAYPPNIVYCGPNNGTKAIYDTMTISNTVDSSKINAIQPDIKKDFDLQNIKAGKGLQQSNCHSNTYESFKQQQGE